MRRSDTLPFFGQPKVQIIAAASITMTFDCVSMLVRLLTSIFSWFLSVALFLHTRMAPFSSNKAGGYTTSLCVSISW